MLLRNFSVVVSCARDMYWRVAAWKTEVTWEDNIRTDLMEIRIEHVYWYAYYQVKALRFLHSAQK
jgi:hypothetical protein